MEQEQDKAPIRVHLPALPHTLLTREYDWCAYTAKIRRMTYMLKAAGYEPVVYGAREQECAPGTTMVLVVDDEDRRTWFGTPVWDSNKVFNQWDPEAAHWRTMNLRAAASMVTHWQPGDILGIIAGRCQEIIPKILRASGVAPIVWEWGIGYPGVLPGTLKTYESYAWAHHVAGLERDDDIHFFDSVVPNCYDPADFTPRTDHGDYLLFMGRPTPRKGLQIVEEIAKHTDLPIKVAGQPGHNIPGTEYVGLVTGAAKADLLAKARALLTPTTYLEPYGGVAVEAMMSGTPVIATDWGGFTETVAHGKSGFRCRTLREFLTAVKDVDTLDRAAIADYATTRYSLDAGARMYADVLARITTLNNDGWYAL